MNLGLMERPNEDIDIYNAIIIDNIIRIRKEQDMSVNDFALKMGISTEEVRYIESKRNLVSATDLQKVAFALGVDINDLIPKGEQTITKKKHSWRSFS